jgi:hypothetical protein
MERRGGAVSLFHRRDVPLRVVSGESDAEARDGLWRRNSQLTGRTTFDPSSTSKNIFQDGGDTKL